MRLFSIVLAGAACAIAALAQTPEIAFTSVPAVVVAGSSYNITWGGGDGISPVTITLRKGNPANLQTISTLTSDAVGYSYIWHVSTSLATASDYALQITQGQSEINYSGLFSLVGGTGSSSIAYSTTTTSNATGTSSTLTGSAASMGTGSAMIRNTTFSSATLSSLTSLSPSGPGVASATTTPSTAATTVAQSTTAPTNAASHLHSSGTLLLSAGIAILSFT